MSHGHSSVCDIRRFYTSRWLTNLSVVASEKVCVRVREREKEREREGERDKESERKRERDRKREREIDR